MLDNNIISVIMRFHDPARLALIDEALFSVAVQTWPHTEVVIVIQNGTPDLAARLTKLIELMPWLDAPRFQVITVPIPPGVDGRSTLLNRGVAHASGRYLAFLDDDDYVYQHAYQRLIESLQQSGAALAAGGCRVARTNKGKDHRYTFRKSAPFKWGQTREDLFIDNFLPIHSYVIDRARVRAEDLHFDDQLSLLEDYEFLLRLAVKYPFDLSQLGSPVCEYRYHEENSLQHDQQGEPLPTPVLLQARLELEARKDQLTITLPIKELTRLRQQAVPTSPLNEELLIELLTKQQRSLNKLVDKVYHAAHQRSRLLALLVRSTRTLRRAWTTLRRLPAPEKRHADY